MDKILNKYKNDIFEFIVNSGIQKELLDYKETKDNKNYRFLTISIKNTKFVFEIKNNPDDFHGFVCTYNIFQANYPSVKPLNNWSDFSVIKQYLEYWVIEVQKYFNELSSINLWEQLYSSENIFNINNIDFDNKSNFSYDEKQQIKLAIADLKVLIQQKFDLVDKQFENVNKRLDYLSEAMDRLNRFDWKGTLIQTIISTITALSLDKSNGMQLISLFSRVFSITANLILPN